MGIEKVLIEKLQTELRAAVEQMPKEIRVDYIKILIKALKELYKEVRKQK